MNRNLAKARSWYGEIRKRCIPIRRESRWFAKLTVIGLAVQPGALKEGA